MEQDNVYNPYSTAISNYKNDGNRTWTGLRAVQIRRSRSVDNQRQLFTGGNRETGWARGNYAANSGSAGRIITWRSQPE